MKNVLQSITLINGGEYAFSTIETDGNVLLSGSNGAGKTTLLRAILFFYNPSTQRNDFDIAKSKKSFTEYYLPNRDSYIIYTYTNRYGRNIAIAFREEGTATIKFKFFGIDMVQEIDLKKLFLDGNMVLLPNDAFANIREISISESDGLVHGITQFNSVIYGQNETKGMEKYALYRTSNRFIGETIKNIFLSDKVSSDSIKSLLASSVKDVSAIPLEPMQKSIDKLSDIYENIKTAKEKKWLAEDIASLTDEHYELEAVKKDIMFSMKCRVSYIKSEQKILFEQIKKAEDREKELGEKSESMEKRHLKEVQEEAIQQVTVTGNIEKAKQYSKEYREKEIERKTKEYKTLEALEVKHNSMDTQLFIMRGNVEKMTSGLRNEITRVGLEFEKLSIKHLQHNIDIEVQYGKDIKEIDKKEDAQKEILDEQLRENVQKSSTDLPRYKEEEAAVKDEITKVTHSSYYTDEYDALKEEVLSKGKRLSKLSPLIEKAKSNIGVQDGEIALLDLKVEAEIKIKEAHFDKLKKEVDRELSKINSLLNYTEDSLLGFIDKHKVEHKDVLLSTLKEDILTSTELEPKVIDGNSLTLCGIELQSLPVENESDLIKRRVVLLKKIVSIEDELSQALLSIEKQQEAKTKDIEKLRSQYHKEFKDLSKRFGSLEDDIKREALLLDALDKELLEKKEALRKELEEKKEKVLTKLSDIEKSTVNLKKEHDEKTDALSKKYIAEKRASVKKYDVFKEDQVKTLEEAELHNEKEISAIEEKIRKIEKEEGVDVEALDLLQSKQDELSSDIERIKKYNSEVAIYAHHYQEYISKLEAFKIEMEEIVSYHGETLIKREKDKADFKAEEKVFKDEFDGLNSSMEKFEDELKVKVVDEEWETVVISGIEDYSSEVIVTTMQVFSNKLATISNTLYKKQTKLHSSIKDYFDALSNPEHFKLHPIERHSDNEEYLRVGKEVRDFIARGYVENDTRELINYFKRDTYKIVRDVEAIKGSTGGIHKNLSRINSGLRGIKGINVVKEIFIRPEENQNSILLILENLKDMYDEIESNGDDVIGEGLFDTGNSKNNTMDIKLLNLLRRLSDAIDNSNSNQLSVEDCFEISFDVVENNNKHIRMKSLNEIGSNGTDVIVKTLIYVAFLDLLKKENIGNNDDIHCLIDEIGTLSAEYFKEVVEYANERGVYFINGMPSEMLAFMFKSHYRLIKNKKTSITRAVRIVYRLDEEDE